MRGSFRAWPLLTRLNPLQTANAVKYAKYGSTAIFCRKRFNKSTAVEHAACSFYINRAFARHRPLSKSMSSPTITEPFLSQSLEQLMRNLITQIMKFGVVGVIAFVIDYGVMVLLHYQEDLPRRRRCRRRCTKTVSLLIPQQQIHPKPYRRTAAICGAPVVSPRAAYLLLTIYL